MQTLLTLRVFARKSPLRISVKCIINLCCCICGNKETYEPMRTSILRIDKHFYLRCKCYHCFRKNDEPPHFMYCVWMCCGTPLVHAWLVRLVIVTTLWLLRSKFVNLPCLKVKVHKIESVMRQQNPEEACTSKLSFE